MLFCAPPCWTSQLGGGFSRSERRPAVLQLALQKIHVNMCCEVGHWACFGQDRESWQPHHKRPKCVFLACRTSVRPALRNNLSLGGGTMRRSFAAALGTIWIMSGVGYPAAAADLKAAALKDGRVVITISGDLE